MREPILRRIDPSSQPIMSLALSSKDPEPRGDFAPGRRRAGRPLPRHRRRLHGQRERFAAARTVGAAARRETARIQRLGRRRGRTPCATRTPTRRSARCAARWTRRHPPGRPHRASGRLPADRRQAQRRHHRAPEPGRRDRGRLRRHRQPSMRSAATRTSASRSSARATPRPCRSPRRCAKLVEAINKELPKGTNWKITRDGGKEAQSSLNNVIDRWSSAPC
jgi:hypothetical protein